MTRQQLVEMVARTGATLPVEVLGVLESYDPKSLPGRAAERFLYSESDELKFAAKIKRFVRDVKKAKLT
jgi:hypothetical protein